MMGYLLYSLIWSFGMATNQNIPGAKLDLRVVLGNPTCFETVLMSGPAGLVCNHYNYTG